MNVIATVKSLNHHDKRIRVTLQYKYIQLVRAENGFQIK